MQEYLMEKMRVTREAFENEESEDQKLYLQGKYGAYLELLLKVKSEKLGGEV